MRILGFNPQMDVGIFQNIVKDTSTNEEEVRRAVYMCLGAGHSIEKLTSDLSGDLVEKIKSLMKQRKEMLNAFAKECNTLSIEKEELLETSPAYASAKSELKAARESLADLHLGEFPTEVEGIRPKILKKLEKTNYSYAMIDPEHFAGTICELTYMWMKDESEEQRFKKALKEGFSLEIKPEDLDFKIKEYLEGFDDGMELYNKNSEKLKALFSETKREADETSLTRKEEAEKKRVEDEVKLMELLKRVQNAYDALEGDKGYEALKHSKEEINKQLLEMSSFCNKRELVGHPRLSNGAKDALAKKIV